METTKIALFKGKKIRKTPFQNEWWFVVNDVIEVLADSTDPAQYFKRMKQRDQELAKLINQGEVHFVPPLMIEIETKRTRMLYKLKGYPDDWIEKRMRGIAIREELTDEWQKRGAQEQRDYEILTAEISKATFGITPSE